MLDDFVRILWLHDAENLLNAPVEGAIIVTHISLMILNYLSGGREPRRLLQTSSLAVPEGDEPPRRNSASLKALSTKQPPQVGRGRSRPSALHQADLSFIGSAPL